MISPFVMLVDDEVPFVETTTKRLAKRNLKVITAFSGQEALEMLDKNRNVDIVILDVKMPGMDGIETLRGFSLTSLIEMWPPSRRPRH